MALIIKAKHWDEKLSDHFMLREFRCHCKYDDCAETKVDMELIGLLEEIRTFLVSLMGHPFPIDVKSGYRCSRYNAEVPGAVSGSQHPMGKAADILVPNKYHNQVDHLVGMRGGVGFYEDRLHVDVRGHMARWLGKGYKGDQYGKLS